MTAAITVVYTFHMMTTTMITVTTPLEDQDEEGHVEEDDETPTFDFFPLQRFDYRSGASEASGAAILVIYPVRLARGSSSFAV